MNRSSGFQFGLLLTPFFVEKVTMCRFSMTFVTCFALAALSGANALADVIAGTAYIDPSIYKINGVEQVSSQYDGGGKYRMADYTVDATGITAANGQCSNSPNGTMWLTDAATTGTPNAPLPAYITFDLGANYDLTSTRVWNYNEAFASYLNGGTGGYYCEGSQDVTISVSHVANPTPADWTAVSYTYLGNPTTQFAEATFLSSYTGDTYALSGADDVRLVKFDITTNYPGAYFPQAVGLAEVRLQGTPTPAPEPTVLVLLATGLLGLLAYAWRRRK